MLIRITCGLISSAVLYPWYMNYFAGDIIFKRLFSLGSLRSLRLTLVSVFPLAHAPRLTVRRMKLAKRAAISPALSSHSSLGLKSIS